MSQIYTTKLGFFNQKANVRALKINESALKTFKMIIADLQIQNKMDKLYFFQKTFLIANTKMKLNLRIFFLILSNANIYFSKKNFFKSLTLL